VTLAVEEQRGAAAREELRVPLVDAEYVDAIASEVPSPSTAARSRAGVRRGTEPNGPLRDAVEEQRGAAAHEELRVPLVDRVRGAVAVDGGAEPRRRPPRRGAGQSAS